MKSNLRAVGRYVITLPEKVKDDSDGIVIPDSVEKERPVSCKVVSVGELVKSIEEGDVVLLPKFGGIDVEYEGQEYLIFEEKDIEAKLV